MSRFNWFSVFWLCGAILLSCQNKPLPVLEGIDLEIWKQDASGCLGKRTSMLQQMDAEKKKLIGLTEQQVITLLGKPDKNELYKRNEKFYYYYAEPSPECDSTTSGSPLKLTLRFNAVGMVKDASVE